MLFSNLKGYITDKLDEKETYTKEELFEHLKNPNKDWSLPDVPKEFAYCAGGRVAVTRENMKNGSEVDSCSVCIKDLKILNRHTNNLKCHREILEDPWSVMMDFNMF